MTAGGLATPSACSDNNMRIFCMPISDSFTSIAHYSGVMAQYSATGCKDADIGFVNAYVLDFCASEGDTGSEMLVESEGDFILSSYASSNCSGVPEDDPQTLDSTDCLDDPESGRSQRFYKFDEPVAFSTIASQLKLPEGNGGAVTTMAVWGVMAVVAALCVL